MHPEEHFQALIYYVNALTDKYRYYGDRLISVCGGGSYIEDVFSGQSLGKISRVYHSLRLYWRAVCQFRGIGKVYLSSYECMPMNLILGTLKDVEVYGFDDGFMNLVSERYAQNKADRNLGTIFRLLGAQQPSQIAHRIRGHYTIYDAHNAAYPRPTKIDLFEMPSEHNLDIDETRPAVKIFLGQPLFEMDERKELSKSVTEALVSHIGCTQYLPHPREGYLVDVSGCEYIDTPYIAEDYLLKTLDRDPNLHYEVYSYFSTTLLNLLNHPRIKMIACKPSSLPDVWLGVYDVLERLGVNVECYDEF